MGRKTKKSKVRKQSTLLEESSDSEGETKYEEMVKDLRRVLKEKEREITTLRHSVSILKGKDILGVNATYPEGPVTNNNQGDFTDEIETLRKQVNELQCSAQTKESGLFSFRDIEESVNSFSGDDNYQLENWIRDFENVAEIFKWDTLQKFVFARRLLQGTAKLTLRSYDVNSWEVLKNVLRKEFTIEENTAMLHTKLRNRKKRYNESYQQYYLAITELGRKARLEDAAIIHYIIEGIEDDEMNKAILYGVEKLPDMKKKLEIYAEIKKKSKFKSNMRAKKDNESRPHRKPDIRCYKCGIMGHTSTVCSKSAVKCFACNRYGHKSKDCRNAANGNVMPGTSKDIALIDDTYQKRVEISKLCLINGMSVQATIDTGSDLSFVREDCHALLGHPRLREPITFQGVGSGKILSLGSFCAIVEIEGNKFVETFHVASQEVLPKYCIIGKTFLSKVELKVNPLHISIKPFPNDDFIQCLQVELNEGAFTYGEHLKNPEHRKALNEMIRNYKPNKRAAQISNFRMEIILKDDTPIYQPPRRLARAEKEIVDAQVNEWLMDGIITTSTSEFASPVVLVPKKDGSKRLCVDYRRLNKAIVRDHQPLPLIEDQIDKLANKKLFSTLDLRNGFFHVLLSPNSRKYTAFVTPTGQYEFTRAPFGLSTSPTQFQRYVNKIFTDMIRLNKVMIYIDDIIILAETEEEALINLQEVLETASEYGLDIKWPKCQFLKRQINYLGYVIEDGKVSPGQDKIQAVANFPKPNTRKKLQSFLGLAGYFRKFVKDYATIVRPMSDLLRSETTFMFGEKQLSAFMKIKEILCSKPVLKIYNPEAQTEVHTDASKHGYGAMLLQQDSEDSRFHPVYFLSRKTSLTEEKYSAYELEVLAVIHAVKKFRVYLLGLRFKLVTDCAAFKCTMQKRDTLPKIARWAMILAELDFEVEHM